MIDTDKYEGHTPGPWKLDWPDSEIIKGCMFHIISDNKELLERFESKPTSIDEMEDRYKNKTDAIYDPYITSISCGPLYTKDGEFISEINARLIADAPLLLAEVKRLQKEVDQLSIDVYESLELILDAYHLEVKDSVMSMFGDAIGDNWPYYGTPLPNKEMIE